MLRWLPDVLPGYAEMMRERGAAGVTQTPCHAALISFPLADENEEYRAMMPSLPLPSTFSACPVFDITFSGRHFMGRTFLWRLSRRNAEAARLLSASWLSAATSNAPSPRAAMFCYPGLMRFRHYLMIVASPGRCACGSRWIRPSLRATTNCRRPAAIHALRVAAAAASRDRFARHEHRCHH